MTDKMESRMKRNDAIENYKIFSDMEEPLEYSRAARSLSKLYGKKLVKFYDYIKNYADRMKSINVKSIFSINMYDYINKQKDIMRTFDISSIRKYIEELNKKEKQLKERLEYPYTDRINKTKILYHSLLTRIKKRTIDFVERRKMIEMKKPATPEIGRYNPKYDAISKHCPNTIFRFNNDNDKIKIKINDTIDKEYTNYTGKKKRKINNLKAIKINNNKNIFCNTEISKKPKIRYNNNLHCLAFDDYSKRKTFIKTHVYNDGLTLNPRPKNIKGNIAFNKTPKIKNFIDDIINRKKNIPSVAFYRPKYSFITNKTANTYFTGKDPAKDNQKFIKLRHIITSNRATKGYQLFDVLNRNMTDNSEQQKN